MGEPLVEAYEHRVGPTPGCGHCVHLQGELDLARQAFRRSEEARWQAEGDLEGLRQRLEKLTDSVKWERYSGRARGPTSDATTGER